MKCLEFFTEISAPSTYLNTSQYCAKIHFYLYFRHTLPAWQFFATVSTKKSNALVDHWLPFYNDERQTDFLSAHELIKTAEPV
jgi:hypothetical protein